MASSRFSTKSGFSRDAFLLFALVLIFGCVYAGWKAWGGDKSSQEGQLEGTERSGNTEPDPSVAEWQTYRNEAFGLEVKYPSDFIFIESPARVVFYDKEMYSMREQDQAEGTQIFSEVEFYFYDQPMTQPSNWKGQERIVKERMIQEGADPTFLESSYFSYQGPIRIGSREFNVFTETSLDLFGELVTIHPDSKRPLGIWTQLQRSNASGLESEITIASDDVAEIVENSTFFRPRINTGEEVSVE